MKRKVLLPVSWRSVRILAAVSLLLCLSVACKSGRFTAAGGIDGLGQADLYGQHGAGDDVDAVGPAEVLATVELENGNTVEFLELGPGQILVGERGSYPTEPTLPAELDSDLDMRDFYRAMAKTDVIPERLAAALRREAVALAAAEESREAGTTTVVELAPTVVAETAMVDLSPTQSLASAAVDARCPWRWFDRQFHGSGSPLGLWQLARQSRNTTVSMRRAERFIMGACSYRGTIHFELRYRQGLRTAVVPLRNLRAGQWWWLSKRAGFWAISFSSIVNRANGDGYHHKVVGCKRRLAGSTCRLQTPSG